MNKARIDLVLFALSVVTTRLGARFRKPASVIEYGLLVNVLAHRNGFSRLAEF
jgi:hypothetical protein